jgi:ABC-2 type transport system permease protein
VVETIRGLWMGHTSTGAPVGQQAALAAGYCTVILVGSVAAASRLYRKSRAAGGA